MTMSPDYCNIYDEIFPMFGGKKSMVIYGVHRNVCRNLMPNKYKKFYDFKDYFKQQGFSALTLDLFDKEADLRIDLNEPLPDKHKYKYDIVMDIGTIEHIFDIKQVMKNSFDMLNIGGIYVLHTVSSGLFRHGLCTINPEAIEDALVLNGFEITYFKLFSISGRTVKEIPKNGGGTDVVIWCVANKIKNMGRFVNPQQRAYRK